ncbi:MAG: NDP-sugar synthase [Candidatus Hydrogenedentota bacterium]|nr:MAG: NDP-sugar synthase [Candidatus Hydrogenedentota bacterium]
MSGGIIAAGEGSRLRAAGFDCLKPLLPVSGRPLIAYTIGNLLSCDLEPVSLIFSEAAAGCEAKIRSLFPEADFRVTIRTTPSSLESFREVLRLSPEGPVVVTTVDCFCPPKVFRKFIDFARERMEHCDEPPVVLGVTRTFDDEKPLWVRRVRGDAAGRIAEISDEAGDAVTAGLYVIPEAVKRYAPPAGTSRLRNYLKWLVKEGTPMCSVELEEVIDVDRAEDVAAAEALALRSKTVC